MICFYFLILVFSLGNLNNNRENFNREACINQNREAFININQNNNINNREVFFNQGLPKNNSNPRDNFLKNNAKVIFKKSPGFPVQKNKIIKPAVNEGMVDKLKRIFRALVEDSNYFSTEDEQLIRN